MACRTCKNYHNDKVNLYVYEFLNKISKIKSKSTKIPRIIMKKVSYLQKNKVFAGPKVSQYSEVLVLRLS